MKYCVLIVFGIFFKSTDVSDSELLAVTISNEETDGFLRYQYTAEYNNITSKRLTFGQTWRKGDSLSCTNGGYKVNILKENLETYAERRDLVLIYTDSSDAVFIDTKKDIFQKFKKFDARIVFAADRCIWPDSNLKSQYPGVSYEKSRFLNAGALIGYANDIYEMVSYKQINDMDDDQLYYTKIFLDKGLREKWNIKIDTESEIFQNLVGALKNTELRFEGNHSYLYNSKTKTVPSVLYGNGPIKAEFNRLANYLANGWSTSNGCLSCKRNTISLKNIKKENYPTVQLSIFIDQPTPFLVEALQNIADLDYPKKRISLYIHNQAKYHERDVEDFFTLYKGKYNSTTLIHKEDMDGATANRDWALQRCLETNCHYLFSIDGHVHLEQPSTLIDLIEQNRSVIAPMISRPGKWWSNFWGAMSDNGYYQTSEDYENIVELKIQGLWNVPYIHSVYLLHGSIIPKIQNGYSQPGSGKDPDRHFALNLKNRGIFMFVDNMKYRGHLVDFDDFDTSHLHNDMYQIFQNPFDWEAKYIHKLYPTSLEEEAVIAQPCPDVYWFPIVSDTFCDHMIEEMENYGKWHSGSKEDSRLQTGYENVPTVDIHMNQIDFEPQFLHFLSEYVKPLQKKVFPGSNVPPEAIMNFVVRYRPDEQPDLQPHDDSSTYTINIGLNRPGIDYTGGGCKFVRYNCSITGTRRGWTLMHPGRLTHHHQGLRTTSGTRYILVSFVNP